MVTKQEAGAGGPFLALHEESKAGRNTPKGVQIWKNPYDWRCRAAEIHREECTDATERRKETRGQCSKSAGSNRKSGLQVSDLKRFSSQDKSVAVRRKLQSGTFVPCLRSLTTLAHP